MSGKVNMFHVQHEKLWQDFLIQEVQALEDMQMSYTHISRESVCSGEFINTLHAPFLTLPTKKKHHTMIA